MLLFAALLIVFLIGYSTELRIARALSGGGMAFLRTPIVRATLLFLVLVAVPWGLVHHLPLAGVFSGSDDLLLFASALLSATISYTWYRFLTWLDVYERERFRHKLFVFLLACAITLRVPDLYAWVHQTFGFTLTGGHWNDWWYSVLVIGGLEETAKLLPWLLFWRFSKAANEPYDLLLYASISALGFGYIENIGYLYQTELNSVLGRTLYASVAHMMFSSVVAYAVAMALHRGRSVVLHLLGALVIAAFAHGFYDYWLLSNDRPAIITTFFFLGTLQMWVTMKNNLINLSPWFSTHVRPASAMFRYRIVNGTLFILALAYLAVFLRHGVARADTLLLDMALPTGWMLLAIALNFSNYAPVRGRIVPVRFPMSLRQLILPSLRWNEDLTGRHLTLQARPRTFTGPRIDALNQQLPIAGQVLERMAWEGSDDWFLFHTAGPLSLPGAVADHLLIRLHRDHDTVGRHTGAILLVAQVLNLPANTAELGDGDAELLGHVIASAVP
ncbi:MAG: PrsW family intramembrane metalloprotease [Flavobacteriales bacterium]|nr:PrsW family intramembrane metalloprotease [Flavobacteriales bacterium]